jgi:HlyD family secretion protein
MKVILAIVVLLGLTGAGGFYYVRYVRSDGQANFRTAKVERGEMRPTIGATGTIEPEEVVDIGAQVAGKIMELKVDYGSPVEKEAVLAYIDPTKYKAAYEQATASVALARANLEQAKATLKKTDRDLVRAASLLKTNAIAQADYDAAEAAFEVAKANVGVAQASIGQAEAQQRSVKTDLDYTTITSPEKGVIVDRRVNVGQTVVSALNTPSLFLLAKDLSRVEIWASVNEADIGRIHTGQKAQFTVATYPNETFVGEVSQVRLNATMTQNVVTYTVVVTTENKDLRLKPYMTANLNFEIERHENVLKVPNAALRWKPRAAQIAPDVREETLALMNRRSDKSKSKRGGGDKAAEGKVARDRSADKEKKSAPATSPGAQAAVPAVSGGTANGAKPEDWKARADQNAKRLGKTIAAQPNDAAAQAKKPAAVAHGAPGTPVAAKDLTEKKDQYESGFVWTVDDDYVRPVKVKIIATDGTMTEVRADKDAALQEDMEIVTGENVASEGDSTTNPFMPKLFRGGGKSK